MVVMAVNTAKQKCPTMSIESTQSGCDVTTEVASTGFILAGSGSACWLSVALIGDITIGLDPDPVTMIIGIVCAVHTSNR